MVRGLLVVPATLLRIAAAEAGGGCLRYARGVALFRSGVAGI